MSNDPDQIREDIERTRANLSSDVDQLGDRANPKNIAKRKVDDAKDATRSVKDKIMGTAADLKDSSSSSAGDVSSSVGDAVSSAPEQAKQKTQGNPLAAGLIAFGVGALLGSVLPASTKEEELAGTVKQKAGPLKDEAVNVAKEMGDNLQGEAQERAESVKDSATGAAQTVKDEGTTEAQGLKGDAQDAKDNVKNQ